MKLSLHALAEVIGGKLGTRADPEGIVDTTLVHFDSRKIEKDGIFFALSGENQNGASYIKAAFAKGAVLAVAESNPDHLENIILVKDALKALQALGKHVRAAYKGFVIGITGSSGKTTSKELVAHMLSRFGKTCFSEGSFNNHIGTPFSLCQLDAEAPYAVFEMGMDHAGEISALVDLVRPNLAAVTNVFPMHMEYFKEFRDIARAKAEIFEKVLPFKDRQIAIINADTNFAADILIPAAKEHGIKEIITFGKNGQVKLKNFTVTQACKTEVNIEINGKNYKHIDAGLGERFSYNAAFAAAIAYAMGIDIEAALSAIKDFMPPKGRGRISKIKTAKGFDITLIDDSYNGQPEAMLYAVKTLNDVPIKGARKIALLGKMVEIGETSEQEHRAIGKAIAASDIDVVIGIGDETKFMLDEVPDTKKKLFRETIDGFYEELTSSLLQPNDILLIKGAHYSTRVFEVAEKLLEASKL